MSETTFVTPRRRHRGLAAAFTQTGLPLTEERSLLVERLELARSTHRTHQDKVRDLQGRVIPNHYASEAQHYEALIEHALGGGNPKLEPFGKPVPDIAHYRKLEAASALKVEQLERAFDRTVDYDEDLAELRRRWAETDLGALDPNKTSLAEFQRLQAETSEQRQAIRDLARRLVEFEADNKAEVKAWRRDQEQNPDVLVSLTELRRKWARKNTGTKSETSG